MKLILLAIGLVAAGFAFGAAWFWWKSTRINFPEDFPVYLEISQSGYDGSIGGTGGCAELTNLGNALKLQGEFNARAAKYAGIAAALAGIEAILGWL